VAKATAEQKMAIDSALSYLKGKTIADLAEESEVPVKVVKSIIADLEYGGSVERKGNKYRIENAAPWS
jgi:hypothetical protein